MIQQPPHLEFRNHPGPHGASRAQVRAGRACWLGCLVAGSLLSVLGCGGTRGPESIPRTLGGETQLGPFVKPSAYEAYVRGEILLAQGKYAEAAAHFAQSAAEPDDDAYLLARLAYAQARAGSPDAAARTLEEALEHDPCSEAVWLTRAELAELAGDRDGALFAYGRASECAPRSNKGAIGKARVLYRTGKPSEALEVLSPIKGPDTHATARLAFEAALQARDPAVLAHALETWVAYEDPDEESLVRAAALALARGLPDLAQRLRGYHDGAFPVMLEAQILRETYQRKELSSLLVRTPAEELGGAQATAELALFAGLFERAELEATTALSHGPSDALLALRACARFALGEHALALSDLKAIRDEDVRRTTLLSALATSGKPALAKELERYLQISP